MNSARILIIDDDPNVHKIYGASLRSHGFEVLKAMDGSEGLTMALKEHPDLILLDLLMPGMSGFEFLKKLRNDHWGKTARVIVLSNLDKSDHELKIADHLVFDYLEKSNCTLDDVCGRINLLLKSPS